jgi:putative pyoverdin transport system ATP-binding/permease protein
VTILRLFRRQLAPYWPRFVILALLSGISSAAVLATINSAVANLHDRGGILRTLLIFGLAIIIYGISQKSLMLLAAALAERLVEGLRLEILERLQAAELLEVESLNPNEIYNVLGSEIQVISDGALNLILIGQAAVLVVVTMLYVAWLSFAAALIAVLFVAISASFHIARNREIREQMQQIFRLQTRLLDGYTDLLEGFKEVKLNAPRSIELTEHIQQVSHELAERQLRTRSLFASDLVASQITFFLLPGVMVFVVPLFSKASISTVAMTTTAILFLIGPIATAVGGLPVLQRVNSAAEAILSLERQLSEIGRAPMVAGVTFSTFGRIALDSVIFRYPDVRDEIGFAIGPINLAIRRNQLVFITGGNGSGKSTLLKLITGLYLPTSGSIFLDDQVIGPQNVLAYRNLFAAIFSDYHLFHELYGVGEIDPAAAAGLLELLEIAHKAHIVGRAFDTLALSTGQRKRLAMVALLLENRPINVFDEWAAEQDPQLREKFYRVILPGLKEAGKTVFAVTHDERYFDIADVRVHLEEGRLVQM